MLVLLSACGAGGGGGDQETGHTRGHLHDHRPGDRRGHGDPGQRVAHSELTSVSGPSRRTDREEGAMKKPLKVLAVVFALVLTAGSARAAGHLRDPQGRVFLPVRRSLPRRLRRRAVFRAGDRRSGRRGPPGLGGRRALLQKRPDDRIRGGDQVRIVPLYAGLRCQFAGKSVRPYSAPRPPTSSSRRRTRSGRPATAGSASSGQAGSPHRPGPVARPGRPRRLPRLHPHGRG